MDFFFFETSNLSPWKKNAVLQVSLGLPASENTLASVFSWRDAFVIFFYASEVYQMSLCLEWFEFIKMRPFWLYSDNFSKQSFAQEEKICALKDTIAQLDKEKETLQECVEEEREKIITFEENLRIKVCSNM